MYTHKPRDELQFPYNTYYTPHCITVHTTVRQQYKNKDTTEMKLINYKLNSYT